MYVVCILCMYQVILQLDLYKKFGVNQENTWKKYYKTNADGLTVTAPPIINITIQIMYLCPAVAMVRDPFGSPADCCTITSWPSLSHDCFCQTFIISRSYSIKITDKGRIVISWLHTNSHHQYIHRFSLFWFIVGTARLEKALQVLGTS